MTKDQYKELEYENNDNRIRLNIAESKLSSTMLDLQRKDDLYSELDLKYKALMEELKTVKNSNKVKSCLSYTDKEAQTVDEPINVRDAVCQTKKVLLDSTPFTNIVSKLDLDPSVSVVDKLYNNIRNFNCQATYLLTDDGNHKCDVKIIKGKHVVPLLAAVTFTGIGESKNVAKEEAFLSIINQIREEAEK